MKVRKVATVAAIIVFTSLAAATPARAGGICDLDANSNYYSWFAHAFGYCN